MIPNLQYNKVVAYRGTHVLQPEHIDLLYTAENKFVPFAARRKVRCGPGRKYPIKGSQYFYFKELSNNVINTEITV